MNLIQLTYLVFFMLLSHEALIITLGFNTNPTSFTFLGRPSFSSSLQLPLMQTEEVDSILTQLTISHLPRTYPFSMIVGREKEKEALILLASNPRIGGIVIAGNHGTGKSILAKALHKILPDTIKCVKRSAYNIDPTGRFGVDSILRDQLTSDELDLKDLEVEDIETPFVQIPLNVMEDSLLGTVDLERSIAVGHNVFLPGLLAKAHRGLLYIDDINLLDENIVDILFNVLAEGHVNIEREGLSVEYPCVPLVVATYNENEGEIRDHLKDRIAITLSTDENPLSVTERVKAVDNNLFFSGDLTHRMSPLVSKKLLNADKEDESLRENIVNARSILDEVVLTHEQLLYLCEEATRAGCEGQRAEIFAAEVSKSSAAYYGRLIVSPDDLRMAVKLVIAPRSKFFTKNDLDEGETNQSPQSETSDQETNHLKPMSPSSTDELSSQEEAYDQEDQGSQTHKDDTNKRENEDKINGIDIPLEFMFEVTGIPLDPDLLNFARMSKKGKGGKSASLFNLVRGRYVKPIFPVAGKKGRLAVGATLRAAAPYQHIRRLLASGTSKEGKLVYIDKTDFRIKRLKRKAGALVVFVVDASGSMALNRMDAAKGAAISLLSEAYKARDKISLIISQGSRAVVLVPPTKSTAFCKARLEGMPCGGGSPLAHAIMTAARVGVNECKIKKDVGRIVIILISDGRANIPLCISEGETYDPILIPSISGKPTKQFLNNEVLSCAKQLSKLDCDTIVIDTEDKFVSTGIASEIARVSLAKYYRIDIRDALSKVTAVAHNS